ncbi:MAG: VOC family protein [Coriobacteriia bacterium]|nr:VOC family protein [Coriobacteriia bacterium]MCL2746515.1 VOC family protein [Coriobacteriia bacterium]MCL2870376.1 VOC family protein [Coriobacteriia bacterium]
MKISPYLSFNGNCTEAIALYEKAFGTKANIELYKDAPAGMESLGPADQVFDAQLKIGHDTIMLNDVMTGDTAKFDGNIMIAITFDAVDAPEMLEAFDTLKEGGQVFMDICEVPWSKCFGVLVDRFGVKWNICQN